jgi:hypothetical protein
MRITSISIRITINMLETKPCIRSLAVGPTFIRVD